MVRPSATYDQVMERGGAGGGADALAAEDRLLHTLFDRLPAMIAYWDRDLRNVVANDAYVEWFGFTPEQMRGIHIREVLGERVYAMNLPYLQAALAGEEQLFDRTLVDTNGRTRHTQASYVPDIVDGEVRGIFVLVTDVTPRVEAQRAMDEAQSLARLGSWSLDARTGAVAFSVELHRIFGLDPAGPTPTLDDLMARVHPDDVEKVMANRERALATGEEYTATYRICRPDGTVREVQSRGRAERDASGAVVRLTGTMQDVTEANEAARELARVNEELVQVNRLNADVLGMLGHDVRGPIGVILGYVEELADEWENTPDAQRQAYVRTIRSAGLRLRNLVDDILALATIDAGRIEPRWGDHDLVELARQALADIPGAEEVELLDGRPLMVRCDPFHVRQIVVNLVSNALRYGAPPVRVEVQKDEGGTRVLVTDEGPGVPEQFVPHMFERFSTASGAGVPGSTGFGLYIAARLAQVNDGSLTYSRGPGGVGARFSLRLRAGAAEGRVAPA
jgi:PAS domain S-box-containing protein